MLHELYLFVLTKESILVCQVEVCVYDIEPWHTQGRGLGSHKVPQIGLLSLRICNSNLCYLVHNLPNLA